MRGSVPLPDAIEAGILHFDAGAFFEAHEAWEDHWGKGGPEERAATLGLIKAAVALHHLKAGNAAGFQWQAEKAVLALRIGSDVWPDLALEALAESLESLASQVRFHGALPEGWSAPRLRA